MGYAHSWRWKSPLAHAEADAEKFAQWSRDVRLLAEYYPDLQPQYAFPWARTHDISIRGPHGTGEPLFEKLLVAFNGDRETGNSTDSFVVALNNLYQENFFSFCKTAYDPYDLLVTAALVRFAHYFPEVAIWSDGEEEGLDAGAKLCSKAFGVGINPLRDLAYRKYCQWVWDSWEKE